MITEIAFIYRKKKVIYLKALGSQKIISKRKISEHEQVYKKKINMY